MVKLLKDSGYNGLQCLMNVNGFACKLPCMPITFKSRFNFFAPKQIVAANPMDHVQIDLCGPFPVSERKNEFCLVVIDVHDRYVTLRR